MIKFIENTDNRYIITSSGRIFSRKYCSTAYPTRSGLKPFQEIFPSTNRAGYLQVGVNGKTWPIHRLVALAFLDNPEGYKDVDHINGDKTDNRVENLRWMSHRDNCNNPSTTSRCRKPTFKWVNITAKSKDGKKILHFQDLNQVFTDFILPLQIGKGAKGFIGDSIKTGCQAYGYYWSGVAEAI